MEEFELFVPGRLCLFGEHSDWAGGHRRQNSEIGKGYTIVAPTNQGTYAKVRRIDKPLFRFKSVLSEKPFEIEMNDKKALKVAEEGELYSYVAGVVHEVISCYNHPQSHGIEIENYKVDLPIKKGLSSSASVCVLTARAFSLLYDLRWTKKREMEVAYIGEIKTPSRCGKMDQACAYDDPILMTFNADNLEIEELKVGENIPLLVVDLKKGKDTKKILSHLNKGFPFPTTPEEKAKHDYLGPINEYIVNRAVKAIEKGDVKRLGILMREAQEKFDCYLAPSCPEELEAPKLHDVLGDANVLKLAFGGKCVGSGGDGTAQLVCKSFDDRRELEKILNSKGYECFHLDLKKNIQ